jgi:hypothetical protein
MFSVSGGSLEIWRLMREMRSWFCIETYEGLSRRPYDQTALAWAVGMG